MVKIVADSSALILLAKCGLIEILCDSYQIIAPSSVIAEVAAEEMVRRYPDAAIIAELISNSKINEQNSENVELQLAVTLDKGERDALLLTRELKNSMLATDDGKAIKAAKFYKISFIVSPRIVVELFRQKKISFQQAKQAIEKLGIIGRYTPDIIANALLALTEGKK
jgi:predicted nucleic acid-binding protein